MCCLALLHGWPGRASHSSTLLTRLDHSPSSMQVDMTWKWQDLPASICSVGAQGHVLIVPRAPAGAGCMFHFAQVGFGHSTAKGCLGSFGQALPSLSLCLSPLILQAPQVWGSFPVQGTELHQITNKQSVQSISLCSSPGRIRSSSTT